MSKRQLEETCERCHSPFQYDYHQSYLNANNNILKHQQQHLSNTSTITQRELSNRHNNSPLHIKANDHHPYITATLPEKASISYNYINDLKSICDQDKEDLQAKCFALSKALESMQSNLNDQITTLQNKLQEQESQSRLSIQALSSQYSFEVKRITAEKDNHINMLLDKNNELTACNEELMLKVDQYINVINETQMNFSANINNLQCESEHLKNELKRQSEYFGNKIEYCNQAAEEEKNQIVKSYENTIAQLSSNYEESKGKFQAILESRNKNVKDAIDVHQTDHDKLMRVTSEYKSQIDKLTEERIELVKRSQDQKFEIERLASMINQSKSDKQNALTDKMNFESQVESLMRENVDLKVYNDKLNRLTHGKIRK